MAETIYNASSCSLVSKLDPKGSQGKYKYAGITDRINAYNAKKIHVLNGDINLIDPVLLGRYTALILDKGVVGNITYGYRSFKEQEEIFFNHGGTKDSKGNYIKPSVWKGGEVATPGSSCHEYGLAIDTADEAIQSLSNTTLAIYGLIKNISSESWHIQAIEHANLSVSQRADESPTGLDVSSSISNAKKSGDGKTLAMPASQIIHDFKSKLLSRGFHRHMINGMLGTVEKECKFIAQESDLYYTSTASIKANFGDGQNNNYRGGYTELVKNPKALANALIDGAWNYRGRGYVQIMGKATYNAVNTRLPKYMANAPNIIDNPDKVITDYQTALWSAICVLEFNLNQIGEIASLNGSNGKAGVSGLINACNSSPGITLEHVSWYIAAAILGPGIVGSGKTPQEQFSKIANSYMTDIKERAKNAYFYHTIYDII